MDRKQCLLAHIDPATQHGLEIGALCRPIVPPGTGRIEYVDHLPTEALREKYAAHSDVDVDQIVPVSYVWGTSTLPEAVGDQRFDYVIASHVIEHVPDPIGWFREIAAVLKPGGVLSLAIPDKRWTFDCRREVTSVSAWIESYFEEHRHPTIRHCVDYFAELAVVPGRFSVADLWQGKASFNEVPPSDQRWFETFAEAGLRTVFDSFRNGTYYDVHCQVLTPFSFVRILAALARLGMFEFRIASFRETAVDDMEFFVTLVKLPDSLDAASRSRIILDSLPALMPPRLDGEIAALQVELTSALAGQRAAEAEALLQRNRAAVLEGEIAALQVELASALAARRVAEAEVLLQRNRAGALAADVSHLLSSTSWRITAPLRALKRLISRRA